ARSESRNSKTWDFFDFVPNSSSPSAPGNPGASSIVGQAPIPPPVIHQGFCAPIPLGLGIQGNGNNLPYENPVVPAVVARPDPALQLAPRPVQQGHSRLPEGVGHPGEPVRLGRGKALGQLLLVGAQGGNAEGLRGLKMGEAGGFPEQSEHDQGRVEGQGHEGTGGEAFRLAVGAAAGDDGYSRGPVGEEVFEGGGVYSHGML